MFGPPYLLKEFKKGSKRNPIPFNVYIKWKKSMYKAYYRTQDLLKNIKWE